MKVQRVRLPDTDKITWIVLGDDYLPIAPVQQFLDYLTSIERSPNTIKAYAYHLKLYWDFLEDIGKDWTKINVTDLADFVAWLRNPQPTLASVRPVEAKRTEATVNVIITSVGMFYEYQQRLGLVEDIPLYTTTVQAGRRYKSFLHHINKGKPVRTKLIRLKEPKRIPKTLTDEEVTVLIAACHRLRDKFLIALMYESGIRVGQAIGLRHMDIQSWDNTVKVVPRDDNVNGARAKTKNTNSVSVTKELMELYTNYLLEEFGEIDSDYVFVNLWFGKIGQPITYSTVADLFKRLSAKTGIKAHPHQLRHSHATNLIRANWDAAHVQKRLGHANVQTVLNTYTHLDDEDLKKAYQDYLEKRESRHVAKKD